MNDMINLDPVSVPNQHLAALFIFVDQDLGDPKHYCNAVLDIPLSRLDGRPARFATENNPCCFVIKDELVPKIHVPVAKALDTGGSSCLDRNTKLACDLLVNRMVEMMGFRIPDIQVAVKHLQARTYTVGSISLCSFMFFLPGPIITSPVITCQECKAQYDLSKNAFIVRDEDVDAFFKIQTGSGKRRGADLLMQMSDVSNPSELLARTMRRVVDLRNDPSIRWACEKCRDGDNGYPGSFILHGFVGIAM